MKVSNFCFTIVRPDRRNRGFSLTELAIVLGVIGVIIGGIWTAASAVYEKSRFNTALNEYNIVSQNMTSLLQGGYGATTVPCAAPCDITSNMLSTEAIPAWAESAGSTTQAQDPWNETGFHVYWVKGVVAGALYGISFTSPSLSACLQLALAATACKAGRPGCPVNISVADTAIATGGTNFNTTTTAMTSATAQTLCNANNYTGGTDNLEFDFAN